MKVTDPGIDYGAGEANRDPATGIRYGIIPLRSLDEWAPGEFDPDYGDPHCPHCGEELTAECETDNGDEYRCPACGEVEDAELCYAEEPNSWTYVRDGYALQLDEHGDVWVFQSPYTTRAQYCSPCAPGAGYLLNPCDTGPRTYCLGPEWFEDEEAPYPITTGTGC